MRGKILKDYLGIWRWENLKKAWENGAWWWDFYVAFLMPCIWMGIEWTKEYAARYYIVILPLLWERLEAVILPMGLSKIQYLCPMTEQERKAHILGIYWLKVLLPFAVFSAGQIVCIGLKLTNPICAAACMIIFLFLAVVWHINPMFSKEVKERRFAGFDIWQKVATISGAIILLIGYTFTEAVWEGSILVPTIIYGIIVIWQALLTGKVMTYFVPIVETALYYENVTGKRERPKNQWRRSV